MFQDILVKLTGKKEIYIENYKNILDYREDRIVLQGKKDVLWIRGSDFKIEYFSNECMRIKGCLKCLEYTESGKTADRW